jgi:hypothetical protein
MNENEEILVNVKTVSTMLGIGERRIQQLVKEGILARLPSRKYDLIDCGKRYIAHIQEKSNLTYEDKNTLEKLLLVEKVSHERAKKRKAELFVAELEGSMHNAQDIENLWNNTISIFKSRIRGLPTKIGPQMQFIDDLNEITKILRHEIDIVLLELAGYDPEKFKKSAQDTGESDDTE